MEKDLRIHIVPVGYDYNRVTDPLIKAKADKVYFILHETDRGQSKFLEQIKKELKKKLPEAKLKPFYLDIWNLYRCIQKIKDIILEEQGNRIFINVSTGTKITAIAGMLACMSWGAVPYYVKFVHPSDNAISTVRKEEVSDGEELPVFEINKPNPEYLDILSLLDGNGGKLKKKKLIEALEEMKIIPEKNDVGEELSVHAKHSRLRPILSSMANQFKLIKSEERRRGYVHLTEQGRKALRIFGS